MKRTEELFLQAIKDSLRNKNVLWKENISLKDWQNMFVLAERHHVLPMFFEAVFYCDSMQKTTQTELKKLFQFYKRETMHLVMLQTVKTQEFLELLSFLQEKGIQAATVKGIVCRLLYPKPDSRISGDEDIIVSEEQFQICHKALLEFGMMPVKKDVDLDKEYEVSYYKKGSMFYIEVHKHLFAPESDVYGTFNRFFEQENCELLKLEVEGSPVYTLGHTEHLFYLICHAYKHFLHCGFGIRQVCDIILYSERYGAEIDWERLLCQCREIHGDVFTAAIFKIGKKYLDFNEKKAGFPESWKEISVDETMLLSDILAAGVYGYGSKERQHSSNITLNEVEHQWHKKGRMLVLRTLFPSWKKMKNDFKFLKKMPWLLPVAWLMRIIKYGKDSNRSIRSNVKGTLKMGSQRIELMKEYRIIK